MASLSSQVDWNEVDVVCGALSAKLQPKNLSSGSIAAVFHLVDRLSHPVNSSTMLANLLREIGNRQFVAMESPFQVLLKCMRLWMARSVAVL